MLKAIGAAVLVLGIAAAGVVAWAAATQPDTFRVERRATIAAPPEAVYAILTDMRRSAEWSPYEKKDPDMKRRYSGAASGKGAVYHWDGNSEIGAGRLEIADADPPRKVVIKLDMTRPMEASNIVEYDLERKGDATEIAWSIQGPVPLISKVMCLFMDLDAMIGADFEQGLADLKALAEKSR